MRVTSHALKSGENSPQSIAGFARGSYTEWRSHYRFGYISVVIALSDPTEAVSTAEKEALP